VRLFTRGLVAIVASASLAACTKAQARTPAPQVALAMPVPPPRVTIPVELPEPEPVAAAPAPTPEPSPVRPDRPITRPTNSGAPTSPATVIAESPTAPVLRTTTADVAALEQRTNGLLQEAESSLGRVKYADLRDQAKEQFNSALSFIKLAKGALRVKNYMQAESLANKAAVLARELVKG
jgi:hypothetical protein